MEMSLSRIRIIIEFKSFSCRTIPVVRRIDSIREKSKRKMKRIYLDPPASTSLMMTTQTSSIVNQCQSSLEIFFWWSFCLSACFVRRLILIPRSSNVSSPLQFRRDQDFSISSTIELNCNQSFLLEMEWTISNGSTSLMFDPSVITTTKTTEFFAPSQSFPFGVYQLTLMITLNTSSNVTKSSQSTFVQINCAGLTANLVPLGTSMITRGEQQDLELNPGLYSVEENEEQQFNASVNRPSIFLSLPRSIDDECLGLDLRILLSNLRDVEFPKCSRWIDSVGWFDSCRSSQSVVFE